MYPALATHGLWPARLLCPWDSPGKNTGVGCHFLLQGIFPTQGLNLGLLQCRKILYWLSYQGSLTNVCKHLCFFQHICYICAYVLSRFSRVWLFETLWTVAHQTPLSMGSPGKNTGVGYSALLGRIFLAQGSDPSLCVSCIAGRFFTTEPPDKPASSNTMASQTSLVVKNLPTIADERDMSTTKSWTWLNQHSMQCYGWSGHAILAFEIYEQSFIPFTEFYVRQLVSIWKWENIFETCIWQHWINKNRSHNFKNVIETASALEQILEGKK